MKCPKCGKEIANDSNFCEYCGAKLNSSLTLLWSQCSLWQKVTITLLVLWFLYASVLASTYSNEVLYLSIFSLFSAGILIAAILLKSSLNNQPFAVSPPNGEKPGTLFTFMGIGQAMMGAFKFRKVDDTYVSYTFFMFLIPLFPTGCYRIKLLNSEFGFFNKQQWNIYGSEPTNWKEVAYIYMIMYGSIILFISAITLINGTLF